MSWIKDYRQASFKNIPFKVRNHDFEGGWRKAVHEFPGQDTPQIQNLGKSAKRFMIDAYILNNEGYFQARDNLINACDTEGPGKLVHPYFGVIEVELLRYRVSEVFNEGGMCRFSLEFVKAGKQNFPTEAYNTEDEILSAREATLDTLNEIFLSLYSLAQVPFNVIQNARQTIEIGFVAIRDAKKIYSSNARLQDAINDAIDDITILVGDADALFNKTVELMSFGTLAIDDPSATALNSDTQIQDLYTLLDFEPSNNYGEDDPSSSFSFIYQVSSLAVSIGLFSTVQYASRDQAETLSSKLFDKIDELLLLQDIDDTLAEKLYDLRAALFLDINVRAGDLSRVSTIVTPEVIPALVLSYELYGDVNAEEEIIEKNRLDHPGFVPANTEVEVISDV